MRQSHDYFLRSLNELGGRFCWDPRWNKWAEMSFRGAQSMICMGFVCGRGSTACCRSMSAFLPWADPRKDRKS